MNGLGVGVISSQTLFRKGLAALLLSLPAVTLTLVAEAGSVAEVTDKLLTSKPAILLIDCEHSDLCLNSVRQVAMLLPSTKCLLLTERADEEFSIQAVRSGAWGIVSKNAEPPVIRDAIEKLGKGEMWFAQGIMAKAVQTLVRYQPVDDVFLGTLTARETEVLALLAQGYRNKRIASQLFISVSTVRTYIEAIYRKTGVKTRVEAALQFYRSSGIAPNPWS